MERLCIVLVGQEKKKKSLWRQFLQKTGMCTDGIRLTQENYKIKGYVTLAEDSVPSMFQTKHLGPGCRLDGEAGD